MISKKNFAKTFVYIPGKVFTPKRKQTKTKNHVAGAPMTKLLEFNPTSRQHIAWALQNFRGARFHQDLLTQASLRLTRQLFLRCVTLHSAKASSNSTLSARCLSACLHYRSGSVNLSEGANSWFNTIEDDGCIHHSCTLATQTGRNAHRGPNLGQVVSVRRGHVSCLFRTLEW